MKKLITTTLIALLSLTSYLNAEVIDNVVEMHYHSPKVVKDAKEVSSISGNTLTYSWREDGTLWQTTHPLITIRFNEKEEISFFNWKEAGITFRDEGEYASIKDDVFDTQLKYTLQIKELGEGDNKRKAVFIHYWGTIEGDKVDRTFNYTEEKVFITAKISKYYKDALSVAESAKKKALLLKEYYKKN